LRIFEILFALVEENPMPIMKNNRKVNEIVLIGDLCLDLFLQIHDYPPKGGDGLSEKFIMQSGDLQPIQQSH